VTRLGEILPFGWFFMALGNFFQEKIAQWFVQNFSHNRPKLTLIRLKFCFKRGFLHVFQKYSKKFISSFMYKKTIKEYPVPLDISIKLNRKHHKTVLYSKSNKNMVGQLFGWFFIVFGRFFNSHPASHPAAS
jgi:hypothetical protein